MSIKVRVSLLVALLLLYPLMGAQYIRESERNARSLESGYLQDRVVDIRQLVTYSLGVNDDSAKATEVGNELIHNQSLFFYPISRPPQIDGYDDGEWAEVPAQSLTGQNPNFALTTQAGIASDRLLFRLVVNDHTPEPHSYYHSLLANGDHFGIRLGNARSYYFRLAAPGSIDVYRLGRADTLRNTSDIEAAWQPTTAGYQVEVSMAESTAAGSFGFFVVDGAGSQPVAASQRQNVLANLHTRVRQSGSYTIVTAVDPPPYRVYQYRLAEVLERFSGPGMRLHVCDRHNNLIATAGQLGISAESGQVPWWIKAVYRWVLASDATIDYPRQEAFDCKARLEGQKIESAVRHWSRDYANDLISYAALPLSTGPYSEGILVAEQSRDRYVTLTDGSFASYLFYTIGVSLFIVTVLSGYLFIWSWRLSRLNRSARRQVDDIGDVSSGFKVSNFDDEIGELSRNMGTLFDQIRSYNDYLRTLAQKLSHEMKTPLAIVSTSLDNIESNESTRVYLERAQNGVQRLSHIMNAMGQAKKLEQSIDYAEFESVDLGDLLSSACEAYKKVYLDHAIVFLDKTEVKGIRIHAAAELIVQMLDKLVDNAIDFSDAGSTIQFELEHRGGYALIHVINKGPHIVGEAINTMFQQLVSFREMGDERPHLGLGLFIARLIAEHHRGSISARNLDDGSGVRFTISMPL